MELLSFFDTMIAAAGLLLLATPFFKKTSLVSLNVYNSSEGVKVDG